VGDDACPFTTLYWDFLVRNTERLSSNHRLSRQLKAAERLGDIEQVQRRAATVLSMLDGGEL
jgi:deoxyribodipyrimidine photolyase-related protein